MTKLCYSDLRAEFDKFHQSFTGSSSKSEVLTRSYGFLDRSTTDWEIQSLGHHDATTLILGLQHFNKSLSFCDFENLQSMRDLLKITRDQLRKVNSKVCVNLWNYSNSDHSVVDLTDPISADQSPVLPPDQTSQKASTVPNDSNITLAYSHTAQGGLSQAPVSSDSQRLGINMNMMMAKSITPTPHRPPPVSAPSPQTPAVPIVQLSARFEISPSTTTSINVPLVARQLFRIFKQADRTIRLLPWNSDDTADLSSIDQEDEIPSSEDAVKTWIHRPRMQNNRLQFALRIESIAHPKHIRDTFVPWMQKNQSFIKLDKLDAKEIYGIGFITDLHPNLYNRMRLKSFLQQELQKQNLNVEINTYVRNVWGTFQGNKISAKAVVIECDSSCKDSAASALMEVDFLSTYRYAKFVPFNKSIVPDEILYNILLENNNYQSTSRRRTIKGLASIFTSHTTLEYATSSVQTWLLSQQVSTTTATASDPKDTFLFEHVEPSVSNDTVLIYPMHYESEVSSFLNNFEELLRSQFLHPREIYDPDQPLVTGRSRPIPNGTAYGQKLAALYNFNPQEAPPPTPSPVKPTKLYYGAADKAENTYLNHLMQDPPKKSKKTKVPPSRVDQPPAVNPDDPILLRLDKLEESNRLLSQSVDTRFESITKQREEDQTQMIQAVTSTVTEVMTSSLPQLIAAQLKVASTGGGGEKS